MSLPGMSASSLALAGISPSDRASAVAVNLKRGPKPLCREAAAQWLQEHLAAGPVVLGASSGGPGTVRGAAKAAGFAWATVQRAFQDMQGVSERCRETGKHMWRLPDDSAGPTGGDANPDAERTK